MYVGCVCDVCARVCVLTVGGCRCSLRHEGPDFMAYVMCVVCAVLKPLGLGIITYTMADRINTKSKKHDLQQAINQSNDGPTKEDRPLLDEA